MPHASKPRVRVAQTWHAIDKAGEAGNATGWVYDYKSYMRRPEWQLFDVSADPLSLHNLADEPGAATLLVQLMGELHAWRTRTADPWIVCNPPAPAGPAAGEGGGGAWAEEHSEVCAF